MGNPVPFFRVFPYYGAVRLRKPAGNIVSASGLRVRYRKPAKPADGTAVLCCPVNDAGSASWPNRVVYWVTLGARMQNHTGQAGRNTPWAASDGMCFSQGWPCTGPQE
jgi:hypothetical protein